MSRVIWEVDFKVSGNVTLSRNNIEIIQEKGFSIDQFYSTIRFKRDPQGIQVCLTAYAENQNDAYIVANVYLERAINLLSVLIDLPLKVETENKKNVSTGRLVRRQLTQDDLQMAFRLSRQFEQDNPKVLRALSWYCKGNNSFNVLDRFTSYWTCIEILSAEYHTPTDRTRLGMKNQIYQCYIDYLDESYVIDWLDNANELRNNILHGGVEITYDKIIEISNDSNIIKNHSKDLILKIIDTLA